MKKDIFFNSLILILGVLFFSFQFSVEYSMCQMLQETFLKVKEQGDIQPSMVVGGIIKRTLFGIILLIISILTIRKSVAFKRVGKVGIFMLCVGILLPFLSIAFSILQIL